MKRVSVEDDPVIGFSHWSEVAGAEAFMEHGLALLPIWKERTGKATSLLSQKNYSASPQI